MAEISSVKEMIETAVVKSRKLKEGIVVARWEEIVGKVAKKSNPVGIKDETLYVYVEDSVFLHHMSMNKNKYLEKIEEILKDSYVKDIKFKVGKVNDPLKYDYREVYINNNRNIEENISEESFMKNEELSIEEIVDHLKKMALKREEYLIKKGYKKCKSCGAIFEGEKDYCFPCSNKLSKNK